MELPDEPTADELAGFLRSNDGSRNKLEFASNWYDGMETWTDPEVLAVADAAQRNTAVRELTVDVADLSNKVADDIKQIISQFRRVRIFRVKDSYHPRGDVPMAHPDVVDALLHGIMASTSSITHLQLYGRCSPGTIRQFIERFPNLERLDIDGQRPIASGNGDTVFLDFAVALAFAMDKLTSLSTLWLDSNVGNLPFVALLSAVESSATVDTICLNVSNRSTCLLPMGFKFFASRCPKTVQTVNVRTITNEELLDISSLFPVGGGGAAFSPSITNVEFHRCEAGEDDDPLWFDRAAAAMTHVEALGFFQCRFPPWALEQLLLKLTHLTGFYCLSRIGFVLSTETLDDEFDDAPYVLGTNEALTKVCQVIERPDCLLRNVDLDIVSSVATMHFPAIASLLKHSKGELIVNFGRLPRLSSDHVINGAKCLSNQLKVLRIRFCQCQFGDGKFASFLRALGARKSLKTLEYGFDTHASIGTPELSIAAIEGIIDKNNTLEELVLRGLGSDADVAVVERILPSLATKNRSLRKLDFFGADLTGVWPRIRDAFLVALKTNGVLYQLGGDVQVPDDDHDVRKLLRENQYGRQFLLPRDEPVPLGLWPTIFARISKDGAHDVMYAFLRKKLVSLLHPSHDSAVGVGKKNRRGKGRKRKA